MRIVAFKHFFFDTETYDFGNTWGPSYSTIEPNVAIIAACIPSLTPLLRRWLPGVFGTTAKKSSSPTDGKHGFSGDGSRSMQLHNMGRSRAEVRGGYTADGSQEDILSRNGGIVKTTLVSRGSLVPCPIFIKSHYRQVNVSYANTSVSATSGRGSNDTSGFENPDKRQPREGV